MFHDLFDDMLHGDAEDKVVATLILTMVSFLAIGVGFLFLVAIVATYGLILLVPVGIWLWIKFLRAVARRAIDPEE